MRKTIFFCLIWISLLSCSFGQQSDSTNAFLDGQDLKDVTSISEYEKNIKKVANDLSVKGLIKYYKRGLRASQELQNDTLARIFADFTLRMYFSENDMLNMEKYALIALEHTQNTGDKRLIAYQYITLATSYMGGDDLTKAIEYFLKVVEISKNYPEAKEYEYSAFMSLGFSFYRLGEIEQSMSYLRQAEKYFLKSEDSFRNLYLGYIYSGITGDFLELEDKDSSEFYMNQTILALQKVELDTTLDYLQVQSAASDIYFDIIEYYLLDNRLSEADIYYKKIKDFQFFDKERKYIVDLQFSLKRNELEKMKSLIDNPPEELLEIYELEYLTLASEYHEKNGGYKKSLSFIKQKNEKEVKQLKRQRIKFSSFTKDKIESINQQRKIEILTHEKAYQSNLTKVSIVVVMLLGLSLALLIYAFYQIKIKNKLLNKTVEDERIIKLQTLKLQQTEQQKNKLFTNIAHELQTPLSIILGLSKRLYSSQKLTNDAKGALKIINRNSTYLSEATNQILSLSLEDQEKIPIKHALFSLPQLLEYILPEFEFLAKEKSVIIQGIDTFESAVILYSDLRKITTILKNIISNAIKYTNENGIITISYSEENQEFHEIYVKDSGKGISEDELPHIFDRYYQAGTKAVGGFGLGLAICQEYIKSLNGNIKITSKIGVGSTFLIQLPRVIAEEIPEDMEVFTFPSNGFSKVESFANELENTSQLKHHLLIVEDNIDFCKYLQALLGDIYILKFTHNGADALEYLKTQEPALIITDWMMPGIDGLELVEVLKTSKQFNHLPILMLTARSLLSDKIKMLRVGVDDYLTKPVKEEVLKTQVKFLIENKGQRYKLAGTFVSEVSNKKGVEISLSDQNWLYQVEQMIFPLIGDFDLNLEQIAALIKTSLTQLNRKIKAITGLTAKRYVQEMRYWEARRMLEVKEYDSVKAVCLSVGFKDQKNFSRKFKERFGVYPSEYLITN